MPSRVVAKIRVSVTGLDKNHQVVELALAELIADAKEYSELTVGSTGSPQPGSKGWVEDTVLGISSLGGGATFVKLVTLWLGRDKKRSVRVSIERSDSAPVVVEASGENISVDGLKFAIEEALKANE